LKTNKTLTKKSRKKIKRIITKLKKNNKWQIEIEEFNWKLTMHKN
jgi:outer membrane protein OmpA-like peptidoglycan-associated protein